MNCGCQQKLLNAEKKPDFLSVVILFFVMYLKQQPQAV